MKDVRFAAVKKAFLYLFLIGLVVVNSDQAFSRNVSKTLSYSIKVQNTDNQSYQFTKDLFSGLKSNLINDFYNENDNENEDFSSFVIKSKLTTVIFLSATNAFTDFKTIGKKTIPKLYFADNFCRIPRFNFLSLRVLRL